MEKELLESYWKSEGAKHLPMFHAKTGLSEALAAYAKEDKTPVLPANVEARSKALIKVKQLLNKAKQDYPAAKHPKINVALDAMLNAIPKEVQAFGERIDKMQLAKDVIPNANLYKLFKEFCVAEHNDENLEFIEAVARKDDPLTIFWKYINVTARPIAPDRVNLASGVTKALEDSLKLTGSFGPAQTEIVNMLNKDAFARFKAKITMKVP